jgi:hypothetical protein
MTMLGGLQSTSCMGPFTDLAQVNQDKLAQVIIEKITKKEIGFVSYSITSHLFKV